MKTLMLSTFIVMLMFECIYSQTAKFTSTDKWASHKDGDYYVTNDVWGDHAGPQTLYVNSHHDWWIQTNQPGGSGVKSYAHVGHAVNKKLSAIKSVSSTFGVTVPNSGTFNTAYDIWADNFKYEIMLWMNYHGGAGPIGGSVAKATVGGHSWDVHKGTNGKNEVFSFLRTSNTNSGTVDVLAVMHWIKSQGWFDDVTLGEVQFGWEIFDTAGKSLEFKVTNFSVTSS
jgi:hypothetical protein